MGNYICSALVHKMNKTSCDEHGVCNNCGFPKESDPGCAKCQSPSINKPASHTDIEHEAHDDDVDRWDANNLEQYTPSDFQLHAMECISQRVRDVARKMPNIGVDKQSGRLYLRQELHHPKPCDVTAMAYGTDSEEFALEMSREPTPRKFEPRPSVVSNNVHNDNSLFLQKIDVKGIPPYIINSRKHTAIAEDDIEMLTEQLKKMNK
jgi:hypothetical protein